MPVFNIHHVTKYEYDRPVKESVNEIRIYPVLDNKQEVLYHQVNITVNPEILFINDFVFTAGIRINKLLWYFLFILIPFKFKCVQFTIDFLDIINFFLFICAPEIGIYKSSVVLIFFDALKDAEVFPQLSNVIPKRQSIEIVDD